MILLGLGANLESQYGKPEDTFKKVTDCLNERDLKVIATSSVWESAPVPVSVQPWYKNCVCRIETLHYPDKVLKIIREIENDFGRVRTVQNAPRTIDIDLLCYNDKTISSPELDLPHPRMHERAFVMFPLFEIAPEWVHPVTGISVADYVKRLPKDQEIRVFSE